MVGLASEQLRARVFDRAGRTGAFLDAHPLPVLATLVVVQWIAVLVFAATVQRNGWLFYQGGDQTWFYTSGWVLAHGNLPETFISYAWPLVLAPIAALAGPSIVDALPAVVLLQVLVLLPLGLLAVYGIATRIAGRALGYWAAVLWIAAPFLTIPLFVPRYHEKFVEQFLPQAFGLTGLGDFASMVAVLGAAYFAVRTLDTHEAGDAVAAGVLAGFAVGIKPANGLFVLAPVLVFAGTRLWRPLLAFGLALAPALLTLTIWKYRGSGISVLALDEMRLAAGAVAPHPSEKTVWEQAREFVPLDADQLRQQFVGLKEFFWSVRVVEALPLAGFVAVARVSFSKAALLALWLASFFVVKGSSPAVSVEAGTIWRLLMPAWPAYFLLAVSIPLLVPVWGRSLAATRSPLHGTPIRLRSPAVLAAAAVLVVVPAVVVATFPASTGAAAAKLPLQDLYVPEEPLGLRATVENGVVRLTWQRPSHRGATEFSAVLRSPLDQEVSGQRAHEGRMCRPRRGTPDCTIEMTELHRTREATVDDRPGPGRWTYRVGYLANWLDDPAHGDIMLVSTPVTVTVS